MFKTKLPRRCSDTRWITAHELSGEEGVWEGGARGVGGQEVEEFKPEAGLLIQTSGEFILLYCLGHKRR